MPEESCMPEKTFVGCRGRTLLATRQRGNIKPGVFLKLHLLWKWDNRGKAADRLLSSLKLETCMYVELLIQTTNWSWFFLLKWGYWCLQLWRANGSPRFNISSALYVFRVVSSGALCSTWLGLLPVFLTKYFNQAAQSRKFKRLRKNNGRSERNLNIKLCNEWTFQYASGIRILGIRSQDSPHSAQD